MSELHCVFWPAGRGEPAPGMRVRLSPPESHHAVRVRRIRSDQEVWAITGEGPAARCVMRETDPAGALLEVVEVQQEWREPSLHVTVYQALVRSAAMEGIIEQGTAIGMRRLIPVFSGRVERSGVKLERWERIAAEAAKQCGRGWIPDLTEPLEWDRFLEEAASIPFLIADESAEHQISAGLIDELLPGREKGGSELGVLIGPEGGFSGQELEAARAAGGVCVHFGPRRMRSETAASVALTLLLIGT